MANKDKVHINAYQEWIWKKWKAWMEAGSPRIVECNTLDTEYNKLHPLSFPLAIMREGRYNGEPGFNSERIT